MIEQVHRITNLIERTLETQQVCSSVFLDIAQAFDNVWHKGLKLNSTKNYQMISSWSKSRIEKFDISELKQKKNTQSSSKYVQLCLKGVFLAQYCIYSTHEIYHKILLKWLDEEGSELQLDFVIFAIVAYLLTELRAEFVEK